MTFKQQVTLVFLYSNDDSQNYFEFFENILQ